MAITLITATTATSTSSLVVFDMQASTLILQVRRAVSYFIRSYTGEVSLLVSHLANDLERNFDLYELVGSGKSLMIRRINNLGYASIRLEPDGLSLLTPYTERYALTPREERILNKAVHKWLD